MCTRPPDNKGTPPHDRRQYKNYFSTYSSHLQIIEQGSALLRKKGASIANIHLGATDCISIPLFHASAEEKVQTNLREAKLQKREDTGKGSNIQAGSRADRRSKWLVGATGETADSTDSEEELSKKKSGKLPLLKKKKASGLKAGTGGTGASAAGEIGASKEVKKEGAKKVKKVVKKKVVKKVV